MTRNGEMGGYLGYWGSDRNDVNSKDRTLHNEGYCMVLKFF